MKSLYYTLADAKKWAEFSGDDNPIHFNLDWVRENGGDRLSVHGMRALLDAKQLASDQLIDNAPIHASYMKCAVRLRNPLWNDKAYELVERNRAGSVAILSSDEQQNCLTCQLSPLDDYKFNEINHMAKISSKQVAALQLSFSHFSKKLYDWQFIDAVLFWHLIHDSTLLQQDNIAEWLPKDASLKNIFSRYPIVQTHQEVIFDSELLQKWKLAIEPAPIYIRVLPSLVIGSMDNGLLISINIAARYKNKLVSNSITLKVNSASE